MLFSRAETGTVPSSWLLAATEQGRSWSPSSPGCQPGPRHPGSCTPLPGAIAPRSPCPSGGPAPPHDPRPGRTAHSRTCAPLEDPRVQGRTQDPANERDPRQVLIMFFRGMPLLPPRARIRAARCGGFSTPRPWPPRELRCSFGGRPREGRPRGLETEVAAPFSTESIFLPRLLPSFSTSGSSSLATSARRRPTSPPDR